ncbi:hypothetical protein [Chryseobacterium paludis]|uniref:hypothetical protein n=1 Tax=Chryseobacterium paludis TaxID=2956784 RepID=UPI0021BE8E80|nr:hypothetical protein [Chryseobacterium paludis]
MKKENEIEKKLSLKKLQIVKLNLIRGGAGNLNLIGEVGGNDGGTNGDTTGSKNCQAGLDTRL